MSKHPHETLATCPKPVQTNEDHKLDEERVCFQAESIVHMSTFPMVLKAALELGVVDTITKVDNDVWLSPSEIALGLPTIPTNPEAPVMLDRMLRLLASHSILKCRMIETGENSSTKKIERVYAAEPVCKFFIKDSEDSGSYASQFMLYQILNSLNTGAHLKDMILEGKDAFHSAHGIKLYEYLNRDKTLYELFKRAMSESSTIIMKQVLEVYKGFEDVNTLVDVGGGNGDVLSLITSKYTHIKGINFDIAPVITSAPSYPEVEHVMGDMFVEVPKGDAILISRTLFNWKDEDCVKILKNCWRSLPEKGRLIIIEMVTPTTEPKGEDSFSKIVSSMDMIMLIHCSGGKVRSFSEFNTLASESGFTHCEIVCCVYSHSVIEFHK